MTKPIIIITRKFVDRFWSKVKLGPDDECWEWQGGMHDPPPFNYGSFGIGGVGYRAHRIAYALAHDGVIPELCVLHRCDNPPCCNPDHLFLGTKAENNKDRAVKGRGANTLALSTGPGVDHWHAKLTDAWVLEIRERYAAGEKPSLLAEEFGVSRSEITQLCSGRCWTHVGGPTYVPRKGKSPLVEEQVIVMRERRIAGEKCKDLAIVFGVGENIVSQICCGNLWKQVGGPLMKPKRRRQE